MGFFHEAGHILLHSKKEVFIDDKKFGEESIEDPANSFSRNMLNRQKEYRNFAMSGRWSAASITAFAKDLEVPLECCRKTSTCQIDLI